MWESNFKPLEYLLQTDIVQNHLFYSKSSRNEKLLQYKEYEKELSRAKTTE